MNILSKRYNLIDQSCIKWKECICIAFIHCATRQTCYQIITLTKQNVWKVQNIYFLYCWKLFLGTLLKTSSRDIKRNLWNSPNLKMYYWFSYQNKYFKKNLQKVSSNFPKWRWRRKWQGSGARLCGNRTTQILVVIKTAIGPRKKKSHWSVNF